MLLEGSPARGTPVLVRLGDEPTHALRAHGLVLFDLHQIGALRPQALTISLTHRHVASMPCGHPASRARATRSVPKAVRMAR